MKTKRIAKKLNINKTTIDQLNNKVMDLAVGGVVQYPTTYCTNKTNCACDTDYNCPSIPNQCTKYPKAACMW